MNKTHTDTDDRFTFIKVTLGTAIHRCSLASWFDHHGIDASTRFRIRQTFREGDTISWLWQDGTFEHAQLLQGSELASFIAGRIRQRALGAALDEVAIWKDHAEDGEMEDDEDAYRAGDRTEHEPMRDHLPRVPEGTRESRAAARVKEPCSTCGEFHDFGVTSEPVEVGFRVWIRLKIGGFGCVFSGSEQQARNYVSLLAWKSRPFFITPPGFAAPHEMPKLGKVWWMVGRKGSSRPWEVQQMEPTVEQRANDRLEIIRVVECPE